MTGWRCGWAIGPAKAIAAFNALQGHSTSNISSITQKAGVAALAGPQESVDDMLHEYQGRRDLVWAWLTEDPRFTCLKPRGAFYLFPTCRGRAGTRRRAHDRGVCRGAAGGIARGGHRRRGIRRARASSASPTRRRSIACAKASTRIHEFVRKRETRGVRRPRADAALTRARPRGHGVRSPELAAARRRGDTRAPTTESLTATAAMRCRRGHPADLVCSG